MRNELRAKTLGTSALTNAKIVEWNGGRFEVRAPSLRTQQKIDKLSTMKDGSKDLLKSLVLALMNCVFVPGTDIPVFEGGDEDAITERGAKDFVMFFMGVLNDLSKDVSVEEAEKN